MRSTPILLLSICIFILIILNLLIIPSQKEKQIKKHFQIDKLALWEIPVQENVQTVLGPNGLICGSTEGDAFKIQVFDKQTGKPTAPVFFDQVADLSSQLIKTEEALYLALPTIALYRLNPNTLDTLWKMDWPFYFSEITIEASKDLLFVNLKNTKGYRHLFVKQATGTPYYEIKREPDFEPAQSQYSLPNIFYLDDDNWTRYYHFKEHHFIFDTLDKDARYIIEDGPIDAHNVFSLTSFVHGSYSYRNSYQRYAIGAPFTIKKTRIKPEKEITDPFSKEVAEVIENPYGLIFSIKKKELESLQKTQDYSFFHLDQNDITLTIQGLSTIHPPLYFKDYFVAIRKLKKAYSRPYTEILLVNLKTLSVQYIYEKSTAKDIKQFFHDTKQLYLLIEKEGKTSWVALPLKY